jgi:hypothetical protein
MGFRVYRPPPVWTASFFHDSVAAIPNRYAADDHYLL